MYKMLTHYTLICRLGTVQVFIRLVFNLTKPIPSEEVVLNAINRQLAPRFRIRRDIRLTLKHSLYSEISETVFSIELYFEMMNVIMEVKQQTEDTIAFTSKTITQLQDILLTPDSELFVFPPINFTTVDDVLRAEVLYELIEEDISDPSNFVTEVLKLSDLLTTTIDPTSPGRTTVPSTVLLPATTLSSINTSMQEGGEGFPGWALAIIIPGGIVIILIPLWILLCGCSFSSGSLRCRLLRLFLGEVFDFLTEDDRSASVGEGLSFALVCILCGCCAAFRRRWRRRRSYYVQYTTHNSLF
ncbi:hypothetical protein AAFF_G00167470 [Aldrovandia affinis]|uniref:Uncharacterized protein n=1 Tax=Aldrovandia affinis TaxID=143900 RepID=A0AAD7RM24_9TELE|nr:hypothetical protein AAFF_G00167470 [Aldrovandia affinis]